MGTAQRLDARLGHAEMLDLAFGDQVADGSGDIFDRHVGIDAMLVQQIDDLNTQSLQRSLGGLADGVPMAAQAGVRLGRWIDCKAELGRNSDLVAHVAQSFADNLLVGKGTIDFGGIEEGDAQIDCRSDQRDALYVGERVAVSGIQAHAAETYFGDFKTVGSQLPRLHCIPRHSCRQSASALLRIPVGNHLELVARRYTTQTKLEGWYVGRGPHSRSTLGAGRRRRGTRIV